MIFLSSQRHAGLAIVCCLPWTSREWNLSTRMALDDSAGPACQWLLCGLPAINFMEMATQLYRIVETARMLGKGGGASLHTHTHTHTHPTHAPHPPQNTHAQTHTHTQTHTHWHTHTQRTHYTLPPTHPSPAKALERKPELQLPTNACITSSRDAPKPAIPEISCLCLIW